MTDNRLDVHTKSYIEFGFWLVFPEIRYRLSPGMAFLEQETALASTIADQVKANVLGRRSRVLSKRNRISTNFQSLTPERNNLHEASTTYEEFREARRRVARMSPRFGGRDLPWFLKGDPVRVWPVVPGKGVTRLIPSSYNQLVMSTVCDAAPEFQFAIALLAELLSVRMLAALPGVSAAISGEPAVAIAP